MGLVPGALVSHSMWSVRSAGTDANFGRACSGEQVLMAGFCRNYPSKRQPAGPGRCFEESSQFLH